ncbi:MAG: phosphatidylglycerophosphatase A [Chitinophagaceae bacterium]|nr:phosphatidylglycerophosphatase A [Chitinophagaceae bacterium]MDP1765169.1 phosphatidylglycerophosphatase A [Sediminibacterium sp.]MDP1810472.1 phosphatidylglycerophosphatase A [Sediminibacterium sp.]MDP3129543.1 phosphatidylglycerophosphatase A [Sediminibacterium sp.]MDP3667595.1 phosphatidylglycerophosphatase A [Sediminibacterium sp.]
MIRLHKTIASCLGIGYSKGGGTIAALLVCGVWWMVRANGHFQLIMPAVTTLLIVVGIWSANKVEAVWGIDSSRVVIDEAAGMCISLLFIPVTLSNVLVGLILFRFFDIAKPLFIRKAESLPGGWGVMADDVLAGFYTNLLLQAIVYFNVL